MYINKLVLRVIIFFKKTTLFMIFSPTSFDPLYVLLGFQSICIIAKSIFLVNILNLGFKSKHKILWLFLSAILFFSAFSDVTWCMNLLRGTLFPEISRSTLLFFIRLVWAGYIIQCYSLTMFVESLEKKQPTIKAHNILFGLIGLIGISYFLYLAFIVGGEDFLLVEKTIITITNLHIFIIFLPTFYFFLRMIKRAQAPAILIQQIKTFMYFIVFPHILLDVITNDPFNLFHNTFTHGKYYIYTGSSLLLCYAIYFCSKKILGMRFLNTTDQVQGEGHFEFINDIKTVLKELSLIASLNELKNVISSFYKVSFDIPAEKTKLYIKSLDTVEDNKFTHIVEPYLTEGFMVNNPLLVRDELEFSYFYEEKEEQKQALTFLNLINADIFIPIYEKKIITAFIIVEKSARPQRLFSKVEYDEMLVFTSYLGALIHLLRSRNLESLIQQEKDLKEELYSKHQELSHYKETIRDFLNKNPQETESKQLNANKLKDPSNWDYMLFLETTHSGKLINKLIPGTGAQILDFKINLLKSALSKKAVLLNLPEEDIVPTVELLHHISLRDNLETIEINASEKNHEIAVRLFGISPLFSPYEATGLLEKNDLNGTIFIKNIHLLSLSTQELLAHFLHTGIFSQLKSDRKKSSSARIICSSNQNLSQLCQVGTFSPKLYHELVKTSATLPSLLTLDSAELSDLTAGFIQHITTEKNPGHGVDLSPKEREKLLSDRPISLQEYKDRVYHMLINKAKKKQIKQEDVIDGAYSLSTPDTYNVARLGKNALKDQQIMTYLWNKFKNQTKIAKLLNVNRSSVNRRCKEFNLIEEQAQ